jgi:hypothetical protein
MHFPSKPESHTPFSLNADELFITGIGYPHRRYYF